MKSCPGGGPQGGLLTGVLFCLQVNKAGRPCSLPQLPVLGQETTHGQPASIPELPAIRNVSVQDPASSTFQHPTLGQGIIQDPVLNIPQRPSLGNVTNQIPASVLQLPSPGQVIVSGPALEARNPQEMKLCHKKENMHKKSYIDDLTLLEKNISLKTSRNGEDDRST